MNEEFDYREILEGYIAYLVGELALNGWYKINSGRHWGSLDFCDTFKDEDSGYSVSAEMREWQEEESWDGPSGDGLELSISIYNKNGKELERLSRYVTENHGEMFYEYLTERVSGGCNNRIDEYEKRQELRKKYYNLAKESRR